MYNQVGLRGLYKGHNATIAREMTGCASYFYCYELLKNLASVDKVDPNATRLERFRTNCATMIFGGLAGQICWIVNYPIDQVKTLLQTTERNSTYRQVIKRGWQTGGYKFFFKGIGLALARAFIVNAVTLPLFDKIASMYK